MIKSFKDLIVWQESHKLVLIIYQITLSFPREEMYCLVNQMRRAVISITSNISEGFSRQGYKEKIQFYYIALGSVAEIQNQLLVAKDINYIKQQKYIEIEKQLIIVQKLLNAFINKTKTYL